MDTNEYLITLLPHLILILDPFFYEEYLPFSLLLSAKLYLMLL